MKSNDAELASQGRRLAGAVLDGFLFVLTLGIGWVIWYLIVARGGQSPAKQLLRTRVIRGDGQSADLGWMLIRDLVVRAIAFGAVNGVLVAVLGEQVGGAIFGLTFVVAALWCVWDSDRQCVWDKIMRTRVVRNGRKNRRTAVPHAGDIRRRGRAQPAGRRHARGSAPGS